MKRFLLKIAIWGLFGCVLLNGIAFLSLYFLGKSCFYKPQFVENGVKETQFDYVVLGSSTGLTTLDTRQIDSITGKKGLNISIYDTSMGTHYLMLQHFYALGKKTKCLVLTILPGDLSNATPKLNNNDYRFLPSVSKSYVQAYYSAMEPGLFKFLSVSRYFPLAGVSYYNTEIFFPSLLAAVQPDKKNRFDERGNYSYPTDSSRPKEVAPSVQKLEFNNPFFKKIQDFCKTNTIELIVYQSPLYKVKVECDAKIEFVNHSDLLHNPDFFSDNIHVNANGKKICVTEFSTYLQNRNK